MFERAVHALSGKRRSRVDKILEQVNSQAIKLNALAKRSCFSPVFSSSVKTSQYAAGERTELEIW